MESRETRLKHSFMLPMPVKRTFCPVLVAVEDVRHTVVVGAVNPLANLRVDLVNTDILKHQDWSNWIWIVGCADKISQHNT